MRRVLKWIGIVLGGILLLALLVIAGLYTKSRLEFSKKYDVKVTSVRVPTDAASVEHGRHLAEIICEGCHGPDLGGDPAFFEGGPLGGAATPNLTAGKGGLGAEFSDEDFVRVLRAGVKPDGKSVFVMPAVDFRPMSDDDLGSLIAYVRSVPSVDRPTPEPHVRLSILGNVMYGAGVFGNLLMAGRIDHQTPPPPAPPPGPTAEYGSYLVTINTCRDCHGHAMAGGLPGEPGAPYAPNLTPGGELRVWSEADFVHTLRTGSTPSGTPMNYMPWEEKGKMTDAELHAIWLYLRSLPARPTSYDPAQP